MNRVQQINCWALNYVEGGEKKPYKHYAQIRTCRLKFSITYKTPFISY